MSRFYSIVSIILLACLTFFISMKVTAQTEDVTTTTTTQAQPDGSIAKVTETRRTISTPVPTAKEVIPTPTGYANCFTVESGWVNDIWVPSHRVCQYTNQAQGVVWIEGYWGCNKSTAEGVCTNWEWKPGRWDKTFNVY